MTIKEPEIKQKHYYEQPEQAQPFKVAKDYDIDIDTLNEKDP